MCECINVFLVNKGNKLCIKKPKYRGGAVSNVKLYIKNHIVNGGCKCDMVINYDVYIY